MENINRDLESLFSPGSIALVGVSPDPSDMSYCWFFDPLLEFEFKGRIYPVNPKGGRICGLEFYPSIEAIPGPIDHVISCIPALLTPQLMEDCVAKGAKLVTLFTAGFSETGEVDNKNLEDRLVQIARRGGVRILGPNCMGIYCPRSRISFCSGFPKDRGTVGFISQSGGNAFNFVDIGAARGLRFSKVISYGNACDIDETELVQYLAHDPETEIIAIYIEGVKDGRRFISGLKEAVAAKPVIVFKGGKTEAGAKTVASHTGALAGSNTTWDALFKQIGVLQVQSLEELVDIVVTFSFFPLPKGRNVGLLGRGGGSSVEAADVCSSAGLSVPPFPVEIRERLRQFTRDAGNILRNPLDSEWMLTKATANEISETIRIVSNWEGIDFLIFFIAANLAPLIFKEGVSYLDEIATNIINCSNKLSKPMAVVLRPGSSTESFKISYSTEQKLISAGLPVYSTIARAANAISKFLKYHEHRGERK